MSEEKKLERAPSARHDVFISYARDDRDFVRQLAGDLKQRGLKIWLDEADLKAGEDWSKQIHEAIANSRICIAVLSRSSTADKPWISKEWASIQECSWQKPDLPICSLRIDDVDPPPFLRPWQSLRCRKDDSSEVASAADKIIVFLEAPPPKKLSEVESSEVEAQRRFTEMKGVLQDLAGNKER